MRKKIKNIKKKHPIKFFIVLLSFLIAGVGGFLTCKFLTKNDKFVLIGDKEINLILGQKYKDEGAQVIFFGKDCSKQIKVSNNIDYSLPGCYYIKYEYSNLFYKNVVKYRYVNILEKEVTNE